MAPRGLKRVDACVWLTVETGAKSGEVRGTEAGGKGSTVEWDCQGLGMRFSELHNSDCYSNIPTSLWARRMTDHGRNFGVRVYHYQCFVPRRFNLRMWRSAVS